MAIYDSLALSGTCTHTTPIIRSTSDGNGNYTYATLETNEPTVVGMPNPNPPTPSTKRRNVRRKALIVGINEYENPNNNLSGCVPDAIDMANTLKFLGFPPSKIKLLLNEQATTEGILKGLDWLIKSAAENDVLIFYYSGHGSQVADLNNDEEDSIDEILVPHDIDFHSGKYITDDMLFDRFTSRVPKSVRTDVILDSCFSGSATRSFGNRFSVGNGTLKQRYLPPSVDHQFRINSMVPALTNRNMFGDKTVNGPEEQIGQNNVLLAAGQPDQVVYETVFNGEVRGAHTYHMNNILREHKGDISRIDLYSQLRAAVATDGFVQIPNLEVPSVEMLELFPFRKLSEIDRYEEVKKKK
jgi:hypothetical protein